MGVDDEEYNSASRRIMHTLKGKGMTVAQIRGKTGLKSHLPSIVNLMCDRGLLVRGKPPGWKSNQHTYYRFDEYYPQINLNSVNEAEAQEILVNKYISVFVPVSENDISWWTGFTKTRVKQITKALSNIVFFDEGFIMTESDYKNLENFECSNDHTINLLPSMDHFMMGYKNRNRYLDPEYYDYAFDRTGNCTSTILVDGEIAGIWDIEQKPAIVFKFWLFEEVEEKIEQTIRKEADKIAHFLTGGKRKIKQCDSMIPLSKRTQGGVMSPLKNA